MPKLLTLDWDDLSIRYVVAETSKRGKLKVLVASEEPIPQTEAPLKERQGAVLKEIVDRHKLQRVKACVAIGRGDVLSAELKTPPATDAELPGMVYNLAVRDLPQATIHSALDFVALPPSEDGSRTVIAMQLADDNLRNIESVCELGGITPASVRMRPLALGAFSASDSSTVLTACMVGSRVDVLVCRQGAPIAARSLRIPKTDSLQTACKFAGAELRRMLLAISSTSDGFAASEIERLIVFESGNEAGPLATELAQALDVPTMQIDPFRDIEAPDEPILDHGRFTPLIGLVLQDMQDQPYQVDFLSPRRPAPPKSRRRPILIGIATACVLLGSSGYYIWSQLKTMDDENTQLVKQLNELNQLVKETEKKRRTDKLLSNWADTRVSWLDEIRELTLRIADSGDVRISRLVISPSRGGSWTMTFDGVASDAADIRQMEARLRAASHTVKTPSLREQTRGKDRVWTFQTTVSLKARPSEDYAQNLEQLAPYLIDEFSDEATVELVSENHEESPGNLVTAQEDGRR